jgi:ABC-2 type transport system permease protein
MVEARTWLNESLESRKFIEPGVVAIVMALIGTFLDSLTIARAEGNVARRLMTFLSRPIDRHSTVLYLTF